MCVCLRIVLKGLTRRTVRNDADYLGSHLELHGVFIMSVDTASVIVAFFHMLDLLGKNG